MTGTRQPSADTTSTESSRASTANAEELLGIFWVAPATRFDRLISPMVLGRAESCTVRLDGNGVSREHALIQREGPLWLLRDLKSKNGTWVNAKREELVWLREQDVVRIGDAVGIVCATPLSTAHTDLFESLQPGFVLSAATRAALSPLVSLAQRDLALVIRGETGTGKELVVGAIHQWSGRTGPLVAVNCAAIPEAMAESLLFGHRKGAFTGARECTEGFIQAARGGTLFLDEVAELPLPVQAKLLRVLEDRKLQPLGATEAVTVDFRLIAACQEPLDEAVASGEFRPDLYARLRGAEFVIPPLRARRQEVIELLTCFLAGECSPFPCFDAHFVEALCTHDWPYNVRELKQLARLLGASGKQRLSAEDLPEPMRTLRARSGEPATVDPSANLVSLRRQAWLSRHARELDRLLSALRKHEGNLSRASLEAGVSRSRARRLLAANAERTDAAGE